MRRLEELAAPYLILKNKGYDVTIASVKGGKIPLDPTSMQPDNLTSHTKTFLDSSTPRRYAQMHLIDCTNRTAPIKHFCDIPPLHRSPCVKRPSFLQDRCMLYSFEAAMLLTGEDMKLLENSVPIAGLKADDFDAIYIPGGHGIAVDGPFDLTLRALISSFAASGKIVSAVCHGPVAFSGPEVNGKPIVAGKRVRSLLFLPFVNVDQGSV